MVHNKNVFVDISKFVLGIGFSAPFTCTCSEAANKQTALVETKEEREKHGHLTGYAAPYKATSGLTGFSSLEEGYLRLDPSERG